jgi:pilus assembly protein Flp/PilA
MTANRSLFFRAGANMSKLFKRFVHDEAGQDLIEYALLAGLISIVCVIAIAAAGTKVSTLFNNVQTSIP